MTKRFRLERMVNFADCDPAQIVYYPRFYDWFDRATEAMFRSVGIAIEELYKGDQCNGMPLIETSAKYMFPCRFGDTVEIESWIDDFDGKRFTVRHDVHNRGRHAVEGREVRVWVVQDPERPAGIRAVPVPPEVLAKFE